MAAKSTSGGIDPTSFQLQMKQNNEVMQDYLKDLGQWEDEIKKKEAFLLKQKPILKKKVPPVRGKDVQGGKGGQSKVTEGQKTNKPSQRIKSFDYRTWDNFDVDKACAEVSSEEENDSSEEDGEENSNEQLENVAEYKRKQRALLEKEKGNDLFKEGKFEAAIEHYSSGVQLDPSSAVLLANRAMALIKMERFAAAEEDCSVAIEIDSAYTKAYFRRGTARIHLKNYKGAVDDFKAVIKLDNTNKQAKSELTRVEKLLKNQEQQEVLVTTGPYVRPVKRPSHLRSKTPLKRIVVDEVGVAEGANEGVAVEKETRVSDGNMNDPLVIVKADCVAPMEERATRLEADSDKQTSSLTMETASKEVISSVKECVQEGKVDRNGKRSELIEEIGGSTVVSPSGDHKKPLCSPVEPVSVGPSVGDSPSDNTEKLGQLDDVPPIPSTAYQFSLQWKSLSGSRKEQYDYFTRIPIYQYNSVLQQSLETSVFSDILKIFRDFYIMNGRSCLEELQGLSQVSRFSVAVMFLSSSDKSVLKDIFTHLMSLHKEDLDTVTRTRQLFGL